MASGANQPTTPSPLEVLTQSITKSVLATMNQRFDDNNSTLIEEVKGLLAETAPEITERATKRMRTDNPELTNPGNIDQFQHNADVLRKIEKAATCIMKGDGEAGISSLKEGKKLITQRQKLVRLADREEKGWKFVREYVKDTLADDSDDEKQIRRARRTVQEKFPARRQPQRNGNRSPYRSNFRRNQPYRNQPYRENSSFRPREQHWQQSSQSSSQPRTDFRRDRYDRECHVCKRRGHLSFDCPEKRGRN